MISDKLFVVLSTIALINGKKFDVNLLLEDKNIICMPRNKFLELTTYHSDNHVDTSPKITGFRAESSNHPIVVDPNGLTVMPDKRVVTLRLFGTNLKQAKRTLQIGLTLSDGEAGEQCDPETVFMVNKVINDNIALANIQVSETISDKPYYVCYSVAENDDQNSNNNKRKLYGLAVMAKKPKNFYYISDDQSMKLRVIGRELVSESAKKDFKNANMKAKLALIVDDANKIHQLADEMQAW